MRALPFAMLVVTTILASTVSPQSVETGRSSVAIIEEILPGDDIVQDLGTLDAFSRALNYSGVPGGIIRITGCEEDDFKQPFKSKGLKLRQVLDSIEKADPRYRWVIADGTINILQYDDEPELWKTRIPYFHVEYVESANAALGALLALPEVKLQMNELRMNHGLVLLVSPRSREPKRFSVTCKDMSLRESLNCIARAQGRGIWDYVEIHCNGRNEVVIRF